MGAYMVGDKPKLFCHYQGLVEDEGFYKGAYRYVVLCNDHAIVQVKTLNRLSAAYYPPVWRTIFNKLFPDGWDLTFIGGPD